MNSSVPCPVCGSENQAGARFCNQCGGALSATCPSCGNSNAPGSRFCNDCGTSLGGASPSPAPAVTTPAPATPAATPSRAQRRLVSVLFSDLVGFTPFTESRDPEEVRNFLTVYFDRSRDIIERFGGTIEKFIGDAVMAVWGTVEARENDAERAVRAALELVDMVEALGAEREVPELRLRAGVLTGEAAVGPGGNDSTGMIVGDLVNSASRLQASAAPGSVFVGETTHRLTSNSILYESAGSLDVKGKVEQIEAFRAVRIIAQRGGRRAAEGLEPPFVGRDDEFRILKDQLHATGRDKSARLVSIVGDPGIGKTRITWELEKYIDGVTEAIYWHHGRSPDYGESLTFWALAEMIRQRAGIAEMDDPAKSRMKLRTAVAKYAETEEDQRWIEPRLAGLLGLEEMPSGDRGEMFAAIRTFFQRIAELGTTVLVFEDLHWADDGLVAFITELVERSSRHPILVITLARPDVLDRYPGWGSGRRNSMSMQLAPLTDTAMRELVAGTMPGIADSVVETVISRAGGVPLYAVEFIRMLVSSGTVTRDEGGQFTITGHMEDLAVPESVQAVIGSRLDRLTERERSLIQDAAVLGQSFTPQALAGIRDEQADEIRDELMALVRDEVLEFEEDARSPERGQYRFVQGLIREVAYSRLSREDRANRHLAAGRYFEALGDIELAAALATHYVAAYEASGGSPELVVQARQALIDAAKRSAELHAHKQTISLLTRALEISEEAQGAEILERMADVSHTAGDNEASVRYGLEAMERHRAAGDDGGVKRAATLAGRAHTSAYHLSEAQVLLEPLYDPNSTDDSPDTLEMELEFARSFMHGDPQRSLDIAERALARAGERLEPDVLVNGIINRGNALAGGARFLEGRALMRGVIHLADELGLGAAAARATWNLGVFYQFDDLQLSNTMLQDVLNRARRIGDQQWVLMSLDAAAIGAIGNGRFADVPEILSEFDDPDVAQQWKDQAAYTSNLARLYQDPTPEDFAHARTMTDQQLGDSAMTSSREAAHADIDLLEGNFAQAAARPIVYGDSPAVPISHNLAVMWMGDRAAIESLRSEVAAGPPGRYAEAVHDMMAATVLALDGDTIGAVRGFSEALDAFSRLAPFVEVAQARAVFAKVVGFDQPAAAQAAADALAFLEEVGAHQVIRTFAEGLPESDRLSATGT